MMPSASEQICVPNTLTVMSSALLVEPSPSLQKEARCKVKWLAEILLRQASDPPSSHAAAWMYIWKFVV